MGSENRIESYEWRQNGGEQIEEEDHWGVGGKRVVKDGIHI